MGFENEKDHPEVAPAQFEINYSYGEVVAAADQIQLYKLICRQVATRLGMTASFLPKPVVGVNGNGMHTNISVSKGGKNIFWDANGKENLSEFAWSFADRILTHGNDLCLHAQLEACYAYRRLDPHFEAPNQIKASAVDRGAMVRFPIGNQRSSRLEMGSVAPDANPYMVMLSVFKTGLDGTIAPRRAHDGALSSGQHLRRARGFSQGGLDYDAAHRRGEGALRAAQARQRRPLPAPPRHVREGARNAVPPRRYNQYLWNLF